MVAVYSPSFITAGVIIIIISISIVINNTMLNVVKWGLHVPLPPVVSDRYQLNACEPLLSNSSSTPGNGRLDVELSAANEPSGYKFSRLKPANQLPGHKCTPIHHRCLIMAVVC